MTILHEIQTGMMVEDGRIIKTPVGWLIGQDGVVRKDGCGEWSCACTTFERVGLCSHSVAVAATEDERIKAIGEEFMRCWIALATEGARMKAALEGKRT
jgi:hypothetical protein